MEVWGCGGVEEAEEQRKRWEWEEREAEARRRVNVGRGDVELRGRCWSWRGLLGGIGVGGL